MKDMKIMKIMKGLDLCSASCYRKKIPQPWLHFLHALHALHGEKSVGRANWTITGRTLVVIVQLVFHHGEIREHGGPFSLHGLQGFRCENGIDL